MALRILRAIVGVLLGASGALIYAASWERWAGACQWWSTVESALCTKRQDHRYDFVPPIGAWEPVGDAAQLAGWSLLVLALAFVLLPWALTGTRPGVFSAAALVMAVLATVAVGVATRRSGLTGSLVAPISGDFAMYVWFFVPPVLLVRFAVAAHGWSRAAAVWLVLAAPLVAGFSYAMGSYDSMPWWEALSGVLTALAGLCLLGAAVFSGRARSPDSAATGARRPQRRGRHPELAADWAGLHAAGTGGARPPGGGFDAGRPRRVQVERPSRGASMTVRSTLTHAAAGALLVNAVPHGVAALVNRPFPSPFADPPGVGLSGRLPNAVWSAVNAAVGVCLLRRHDASVRDRVALVVSGSATAVALAAYFGSLDLDR
ncbi:hypothetical protein [Nocardioides pantholopis]|uniref:hypothetical protein n=1 Tax=Nocardioides pantholopis TaxID=2483798 RepID=UPI000FDB56F1|nr:hypothetical protein [Nocardioides pantholopis]